MQITRELKTFVAESSNLEDMIVLSANARNIRHEYESKNIPVPEWLDDVYRRLTAAIDTQTRESKLLRLKNLQAEEEKFLSREEKAAKIRAEREALEAELAGKV
jgi:hypothetical protein